ncbi:MAG: PRC-barrel domain-containing protein [Chloroflexi bacterium]|nr:PRC-barrel domain-containing protein [Chloroflexota bacterium]MCI0578453.1 PRC-barrel domain-containing protein [Chloroflexota bacterium]MCI0643899.1 PRC-barrel domain-containing protein [Chloroflexota bacterium]MCI0729191.1 PRC-barrel domain-containing protein [Chloroflexota bacterium]
MLRGLDELRGYKVLATDDEIGQVDDFYFDDQYWTVRYLVVNTGGWLFGRRVLLSPTALGEPGWAERVLPVALTREQVEKSPAADLAKPVSRQYEMELHTYYGWLPYWAGYGSPIAPSALGAYPAAPLVQEEPKRQEGDPHLQSVAEVSGYHIQATDGEIGHVEDFLAEDDNWFIRYMVVDTSNWLPGRKVLVSPSWVKAIRWSESEVVVDLKRETIKNSPEYDPSAEVNRAYEKKLHDYYGRRGYWM